MKGEKRMKANKIIKKKYARIKFKLTSSLSIGSGDNEVSDNDIIKDAAGRPYIPASAIAGVTRDILKDQNDCDVYYGFIKKDVIGGDAKESMLIFYDALLVSDKPDGLPDYHITVRDSVAVDDHKTAIEGAKFDREILEPGVSFVTYVEQSFTNDNDTDYIELIKDAFLSGNICFGGKTMRGYGDIELTELATEKYDLRNKEDVDKWLHFDVYDHAWDNKNIVRKKSLREILLELELISAISVNRYTTKVSEKTMPDTEQMTVKIGDDEIPVIPGTTWAGAFEHRMKEYGISVGEKGSIFGYAIGEKNNEKEKSLISFSESLIKNAKPKILSRNAIDRFSGGTKKEALFTEKTYYGGSTKLRIGWRGKKTMPDKKKKALAATITDLHLGLLSIGGETAIGRGLFKVKSINGKELPESDEAYEIILGEVKEVFDL